jgi:hypothetical protein
MKTFLTALVMGLCGAVAVSVAFSAGWPIWVMFIAWVSYYLFGKTIQSSCWSLLQISAGILMGVGIRTASGALSPVLGQIGFPLTVFILIGSLAYLSKIKGLNNVPAWFLGLIIFFGIHPELEPMPILELLIPVVAGFVFAMLNDYGVRSIHKFKTVKQ